MAAFTLFFSIAISAQLAPSADPRPIPITGVVVDPAGKPAADVAVWLIDGLSPRAFRRFGDEFFLEPYTRRGEGLPPVRLQTRTDPGGKFALDLPAEFAACRWQSPLALVAIKPGLRAGLRRLHVPPSLEHSAVKMVLEAPAGTEIQVLDPEGKPVAGTNVFPSALDDVPIPDALGRQLGGTCDCQGRVVLPLVPRSLLREILIDAPGFGWQRIRIDREDATILRLAPVGRLMGRLVAPANEPIRGVTVRAATLVGGFEGSGQGGEAEVACDPSGRFEIPAIAAGMLTLDLIFDPRTGTGLRTEPYHGIILAAGTTTELTIPLRPTVRITGSFREQGTGRPISGVLVALNGMFGGDHFAVTDGEGKYQGFITRENFQPYGWPIRIPAPFFQPSDLKDISQRMPPPGTDVLVVPPIDLPRGVDVPGTVVDESGRTVADSLVEATWSHGSGRVQFAAATTDRQGRFVLSGVDPVAELSLKASQGDSRASGEVTVRAEAVLSRPLTLRIRPERNSPLRGRVLDPSGQPIPGATVRIWRLAREKNLRVVDLEPILSTDGRVVVRTDAEGRYEAPRQVTLPDEFFAEASAPGRLSDRSRAVKLVRKGDELPAVVLRRIRAISGLVVDRQGRPVPGASVQQAGDGPMPTATNTDEQGQFELSGVLEGPPILLVRKVGYRTEPHLMQSSIQPFKIALTRDDEPPVSTYKTLPSPLPADEEKALARRLVRPLVERVLKEGKDQDRSRLLRNLAEIDPAWTLELLDKDAINDPEEQVSLRNRAAVVLARESPDDAATLVETLPDPERRAQAYVELAGAMRTRDPVRARRLVEQAIVNNRATTAPRPRIFAEISIIQALIDLNDTARAQVLVGEVRKLMQSGLEERFRSTSLLSLMPSLAPLDPAGALTEFEQWKRQAARDRPGQSGSDFDYLTGQMALALADRSPADAEKLMRSLPFQRIRVSNDDILKVCFRMAAKDPRAPGGSPT